MPKRTNIINSRICSDHIRVDLGGHPTTSISDEGWEVIDPIHIACWKSAKSLLGARSFEHDGHHVELKVDWSPVIRRLQRHHGIMQRLETAKGTAAASEIASLFPQSSVRVDFHASYVKQAIKHRSSLHSLVEYFLYDLFIIMNIACPASCDFYSTRINSESKVLQTGINLSNFHFESALLASREERWPEITFLPLEKVMEWFSSVRTELRLVPTNRMERVLFAILHLSKINVSPMTVIWIFYALETMFDTKAGENFRSLISRIQLLLSPSANEFRLLNKGMRELYDLRSAFVHGGLDVIHPIHDETLDKSVDDVYGRLMRTVDFGFQVILSSLQEVIRQGWHEPAFKEVLQGR